PSDIGDLHAYLKTLPAVPGRAADNDLSFPFNVRRGIGLWKRLYLSVEPVVALPDGTPDAVEAGRYLVEGPGHCGERPTPRTLAGTLDTAQWLAGATTAEGPNIVPNITSGRGCIGK